MNLNRLFLNNWRAKLMALTVATAVWYLIKKNVDVAPDRWGLERRPAEVAPVHH